MVEQRGVVVEELGVHRPGAESLLKLLANDCGAELGNRVVEQEAIFLVTRRIHVAHAFILRGKRTVHGLDDGREPAFLDGASRSAQRVVVVRVQLQSPAGRGKAPRYKDRRKAQDAFITLEGLPDTGSHAHL
jgi:hypothetical protein